MATGLHGFASPATIRTSPAYPTAPVGSFSPPHTGLYTAEMGGAFGAVAPASLAEAAVAPSGALTTAQRDMIAVIEREFLAAGYDARMAAAAVANAYHESRLNPRAAGDVQGGVAQSIGLFQLYSKGAGAGMSVADRQDPTKNTRRIIAEVNSSFGSSLRAAWSNGASVAELARLFCIHIERPKDSAAKGAERAATAAKMFPTLPTLAAGGKTGYALIWAGLGAATLLAGALYLRSRRSSP